MNSNRRLLIAASLVVLSAAAPESRAQNFDVGGIVANLNRWAVWAEPRPDDIRWVPAHPTNYRAAARTAAQIDSIVIHIIEGHAASTISTWSRPMEAGNRKSSHFVIDRRGAITQMVRVEDIAWHGNNHNPRSIGIDLEGFVRDGAAAFTPEMMNSAVSLVRWLCQTWGVDRVHPAGQARFTGRCDDITITSQFNGHGIVLHNQINPCHTCPGPHFPMADFMSRINVPPKMQSVGPGGAWEQRQGFIQRDELVRLDWVEPIMSDHDAPNHRATRYAVSVRWQDPTTGEWLDVIHEHDVGNRTSVSIPNGALGLPGLPEGLLTWTVRAFNGFGQGKASDRRYFFRLSDVPSRPRLSLPPVVVSSGPIVGTWRSLALQGVYAYEVRYRLQGGDGNWGAWSPVFPIATPAALQFDLRPFLAGGTRRAALYVRGVNALGPGGWASAVVEIPR